MSRDVFSERLGHAFATLEEAVAEGAIRMYGTATWNGYRQPPSARGYLPLSEVVALAREVGGRDHHCKVIQLPHNLGMPEALTRANQLMDGEWVSTLEAASRLGILVVASASIMQGQMARNLPPLVGEALGGLATDAQRAIQFVRSTPGLGGGPGRDEADRPRGGEFGHGQCVARTSGGPQSPVPPTRLMPRTGMDGVGDGDPHRLQRRATFRSRRRPMRMAAPGPAEWPPPGKPGEPAGKDGWPWPR